MAWLEQLFHSIKLGFGLPLLQFLMDGRVRFWWAYVLVGLGIAYLAYHARKQDQQFFALLTSKDVWWSKSAINDYVIFFTMPVVRLAFLSWAFLNWQTVSAWVVAGLQAVGVRSAIIDAPVVAATFGLTLVLFLVDDFLRWYVHYLHHKVPVLWEFHKVHHSAEQLNFATSERTHPVEEILFNLVVALGMGVANGLFIVVFGDYLTVATVAGANIFLFGFNMVGGVLRHSPFWISFGPAVERYVISPAMHQIHHSAKEAHFDRNMGGSLAIWDRWFGTHLGATQVHVESYGIGAETMAYRSLWALMVRPFEQASSIIIDKLNLSRFLKAQTALPGRTQGVANPQP